MKNRIWILGTVLMMVSTLSCVRTPKEQWHHPLYMGNNDYWRQRIPVSIRNSTNREIAGDPVELKIGNNQEQVPLVGMLAEGIRVTGPNGEELLFRISDKEGKLLERGLIPENSIIVFPVECKKDTLTTNYIYFDNPSAWPVGDYFQTNSRINDSITASVLKKEILTLKEKGETDKWFDDNTKDQYIWQSRAAIKTINYSQKTSAGKVICADIEGILNRLHSDIDKNTAIQVADGLKAIPYYKLGNYILFKQNVGSSSEQTNYIYFSSGDKTGGKAKVIDVKNLNDLENNLVRNSDFESRDLTGWKGINGTENISISADSYNGAGSVQLQIATGGAVKEVGLEQTLPVKADRLFLLSVSIKCSDLVEQPDFLTGIQRRTLKARFIDRDGKTAGKINSVAVNPDIHIDNDWTNLFMLIKAPDNADSVKLQLVNSALGTVWFDDVKFIDVITGETSPLAIERKEAKDLKELTVWQEDPIVKVFQDDLPPKTIIEASISVARNEVEPLQLVIRSPLAYKQLQIKVNPPSDTKGNILNNLEVGVVGYVPINYPSNYINDRVTPAWRQKIPSGRYGSDGWIGWWPDPILPFQSFDLSAFKNQPVWIEVSVPKNAAPGDYFGQVQLINNGEVLKEVPFNVHVWDFELPERSHMVAEYDARTRNRNLLGAGRSQDEIRKEIWRMLAKHRLNPDMVTPAPTWKIENGKIIFDFTEFDKAARYYFDDLKFSRGYSPQYFYFFTWANLPGEKFGEKPYPGEFPYTGVDRGKLRPEYKKAYQTALRIYWNHMKEKGWADKIVFYVSDEPLAEPEITAQMRALCDMVHEVDPKIPIYVSTWWYRPEYKGYVDVWGVSNHGGGWGRPVPVTDLMQIKQIGGRLFFTTDGKMCTDTPYLGFERMLPYFCFKYGAEEYEFWASNWYTLNPFEYGWHSFISQSDRPGDQYWIRYPNGDGDFIYPGKPIGVDSLVATIRLKLAREGVEDYEYLYYLNSLITIGSKQGKDISNAENAINSAKGLVTIPSAEGRYSTKYLPDPYEVMRVRKQIGEAIEGLLK